MGVAGNGSRRVLSPWASYSFAELSILLWVRGLSVSDYISNRDPVAGAAYVLLLVVFAVAPAFGAETDSGA